jgi:methyl-accepting chemotaxis protein
LEPLEMKKMGLFGKTALRLSLLFLVITGTISIYSTWNLRKRLMQEFDSKGVAIANSIAGASVEVILKGEASAVQALIDQYTGIEGVGYVFVRDADGEVIAHTFVPAVPAEVLGLAGNKKRTVTNEIDILNAGRFTDISSPVLAGTLGFVHVGMDQRLIDASTRSAVVVQIYLIGIIFILTLVLTYLLARSITRPIKLAADVAEGVAAGNLTKRVEANSKDEVGQLVQAIGTMTGSLNSIVGQVQRSGIEIISTATHISSTAKDQERMIDDLRLITNEIVAATTQISATSGNLAQTMKDVTAVAGETAALAETGRTGLASMRATMAQLVEATQTISSTLSELSARAEDITSIITTITKVADQTNLLSLNAAIEAHKAGDYGRGFGVVAREIRRLADQTAVSTLDIEKMVTQMQQSAKDGVKHVEAFSGQVINGAQEVGSISARLAEIIQKVQALTPRFEAVMEGTVAQSQGAQQIRDSVVHLSEAASSTSQSVSEFQKITEQLQHEARSLQKEVSRFKTIVP